MASAPTTLPGCHLGFDLNKIRQELYSTRVEMWKISSPKVDILVSWPPGEVLPDLKKWMVVCLQNLECRTVPTEGLEMDLSIPELYLSIGNGGRLEILDSNDPDTCRRESQGRWVIPTEDVFVRTGQEVALMRTRYIRIAQTCGLHVFQKRAWVALTTSQDFNNTIR
ncbi:hypothetical protein GWK47_040030 [Chionoecetes opilio]|uniref:Uncharacterized protein n=1 Tax=Chionoecetes opilio TaxID=41210 RepID=A0A8J5D130_CHIOP|nr:hypothetical protein GWK47_040030 [Chionoecetes opilio]